MPASWSYSTATYSDPNSSSAYYENVTEHIITVNLPAYSTDSFFVDSVNPHLLDYTFNIQNYEAFTAEYMESLNTQDLNPDLHSARHLLPFYQLAPAPPSGPGSSGYVSGRSGFSLDGSGNVFVTRTKLIFRVNAAFLAETAFYTSTKTSIYAVAIPPGIQALFSSVIYNVPPTHMLLAYQGSLSGMAAAYFVRYAESITSESKYLFSSYDARINEPSPTGAPSSYLIASYIACYSNGDTYLSYYPFHNVFETTSGGRVVYSDYQVFPGVAPTSLDLTVTYNDKNNNLISTQSFSSPHYAIKPNHYVAEIDSGLSIPPLCTSVGVAVNYTASSEGFVLLHPGYSPVPCQEIDGGWIPGVLWKV